MTVKREYQFKEFDQPLEIAALTGNVSLKDGRPFLHAHAILTDEQGHTFGGHPAPGTVMFACEFRLEAFDGPEFTRGPDAETGLALWATPE
ncbi:MAG: DUF296 domain-containing protein [Verrucomicrobiota bacterium]|nr:DUF296 domain-containing protein [Verrucomicrobiota bacterium]